MLIVLFILTLTQEKYLLIVSTREAIGMMMLFIVLFLAYLTINQMSFSGLDVFGQRKKIFYYMVDYSTVIVSAVLFLQLIFVFLLFPAIVSQTSMNPTLFEGQRVVVTHQRTQPNRFDVVVISIDREKLVGIYEIEDNDLWVKRVIGLPGEDISFVDGKLFVNQEEVYEAYLYNQHGLFYDQIYQDNHGVYHQFNTYTHNFELDEVMTIMGLDGFTIPEGYYLVLGDNRSNSKDSRHIGLIPEALIIGRCQYVIDSFFRWEKLGE